MPFLSTDLSTNAGVCACVCVCACVAHTIYRIQTKIQGDVQPTLYDEAAILYLISGDRSRSPTGGASSALSNGQNKLINDAYFELLFKATSVVCREEDAIPTRRQMALQANLNRRPTNLQLPSLNHRS